MYGFPAVTKYAEGGLLLQFMQLPSESDRQASLYSPMGQRDVEQGRHTYPATKKPKLHAQVQLFWLRGIEVVTNVE